MNESNEEILNKTFDDIKKEQKNKILPSVENFLIGTLGGLLIDYMRNGWPSSENINGFILRGIAGGFIVLAFYIVRMKKKCYDKWIDTQDEQIEILKEELRGKSSSYAINEDIEQNIIDFMCDIVENTDCVDAIQLHSYDIIPEGKKNKIVLGSIVISFALSYFASIIKPFRNLSEGMRVLILTVVISSVVAVLFPVKREN